MLDLLVATLGFLLFALALALIIVLAHRFLVPDSLVPIHINHDQTVSGHFSQKLLQALNDNHVNIPSACAGAGTCGLCKVHIGKGIPPANPIEQALLSTSDRQHGFRLACQVNLRDPLSIELSDQVLNTRAWEARVVSSRTLSPSIRELHLSVPNDDFSFEPGDFMQITAPAGEVMLSDIASGSESVLATAKAFPSDIGVQSDTAQTRAYSLANRPEDEHSAILMIRLALAPDDQQATLPAGFVSSWLFTLKPGDTVTISGPHSGFHIQDETRELVFIGGGVGLAPLRAMIHHQLERGHTLPMHLYFGARTEADLLYTDEFNALSDAINGFTWVPALSEPSATWTGKQGFIHAVFTEVFLAKHPTPQSCDYYLCGPPLMVQATVNALHTAGVQDSHIYTDDFG